METSNPTENAPPDSLGVSIIIPSYNYAHFITEAVDSALAQTYAPIEVIVVDDGSTDDTAQVIARYADPRVRYLHQSNAGLSAARNTGIRHARYPYVSFLDSDDKLLPPMCQRLMEQFSALPAEFALIGCAMIRMDAAGVPLQSKHVRECPSRELKTRHFLLKNRFPCNIVARKEAFEQCGNFDTTLTSSEDRDMWIRIASRRRVFICGEPLVLIRRHANSMSRNADRMKRNMRRVLAKAWRAAALPRWDPFWLKALSFNHLEVAWMCHDQERFAKALYHLAASSVLWPYFHDTAEIDQPRLFRLRSLARFLINAVARKQPTSPTDPAGFAPASR